MILTGALIVEDMQECLAANGLISGHLILLQQNMQQQYWERFWEGSEDHALVYSTKA